MDRGPARLVQCGMYVHTAMYLLAPFVDLGVLCVKLLSLRIKAKKRPLVWRPQVLRKGFEETRYAATEALGGGLAVMVCVASAERTTDAITKAAPLNKRATNIIVHSMRLVGAARTRGKCKNSTKQAIMKHNSAVEIRSSTPLNKLKPAAMWPAPVRYVQNSRPGIHSGIICAAKSA